MMVLPTTRPMAPSSTVVRLAWLITVPAFIAAGVGLFWQGGDGATATDADCPIECPTRLRPTARAEVQDRRKRRVLREESVIETGRSGSTAHLAPLDARGSRSL